MNARVLLLLIALLVVAGCQPAPPPGYCTALVKSYEECRDDPECWGNRHQWASSSYMGDLSRCHRRISRGEP